MPIARVVVNRGGCGTWRNGRWLSKWCGFKEKGRSLTEKTDKQ
jgi:hypothetical protein